MKKNLQILILFFIFTSHILADNKDISNLISNIKEKTIKMQYYFIKSGKNNFFLINIKTDNTFNIWNFTKNKKWKPVHNAKANDGFAKAENKISSLFFDNGNIIIGESLISEDFEYKDEIENKTFKTMFYFWISGSTAYLLKPKSTEDISIWNFTNDKKWRPVHNAQEYDGFSGAGETLFNAKFDFTNATLTTGTSDPITNICIETGFCL
jgi:hypothetical protein